MSRVALSIGRKSARQLTNATTAQILNAWCKREGFPPPVPEYAFWPKRRFRFDWAWPQHRLAVEQEGGIWLKGGGRHTRGKGFLSDCVKYNRAALDGWCVLRTTPDALLSVMMLDLIREGLTRSTTR